MSVVFGYYSEPASYSRIRKRFFFEGVGVSFGSVVSDFLGFWPMHTRTHTDAYTRTHTRAHGYAHTRIGTRVHTHTRSGAYAYELSLDLKLR